MLDLPYTTKIDGVEIVITELSVYSGGDPCSDLDYRGYFEYHYEFTDIDDQEAVEGTDFDEKVSAWIRDVI